MPTTTVKPSFFQRAKAEAKLIVLKIENEEPAAEKAALATIAFLKPIVKVVLVVEDPELVPLVDPIADRISAGLVALTVAVKDVDGKPSLSGIVDDIATQFTQFTSVLEIKDPGTLSKIGVIVAELQAVVTEFAPAPATTPTTPTTTTPAVALKS